MTLKPAAATIGELLSWGRPHGSEIERRWVHTFIYPYAPNVDGFGNRWVRIGDAPILWSCHTDTMAASEGEQRLVVQEGILKLAKGKAGMCLGADDGAGCWLLIEMIEAKIPGLYVFHRGEERGGLGSDWIRKNNKKMLDGIEFAIAFDRKGKEDVITHQMVGRTASDDAALQIATILGGKYFPSNTGTFTDTANYADIVPECTNISVGYEREHGPTESLDLAHLFSLRKTVLTADWSQLKAHRKPGDFEVPDWPEDDWARYDSYYTPKKRAYSNFDLDFEEEFIELVQNYPEVAVQIMRGEGWTTQDFLDAINRDRVYYDKEDLQQ
ncbi:MAG TPA: hypothetical protein VGR84_18755 [Candidatus Acidoferrales bacterium]|nr:hypothetical protein [Candidatus Acidoferrales bacterium]